MSSLFIFLQRLLPKHLLSRLAGRLAESEKPIVAAITIRLFYLFFRVDLTEANRKHCREYQSFNDFFTRSLREDARPIGGELCSPVDGVVAALGNMQAGQLIQSKGINYSLSQLLAEDDISEFTHGSFITLYLAPRNYHRVHTPCRCVLTGTKYIPGRLFSVNQATAAGVDQLLATNERLVCRLTADLPAGKAPMYCVMVGAMLVAGIKPIWLESPCQPGRRVDARMEMTFGQGDEVGQFQMGSTVVLVFGQSVDFLVTSGQQVKFGQPIA